MKQGKAIQTTTESADKQAMSGTIMSWGSKSVDKSPNQHTEMKSVGETDSLSQCSECGSEDIAVSTRGEFTEYYCPDCGFVLFEDAVDTGPEWRDYDSTEGHTGSRNASTVSEMYHDKGMGSVTNWGSVQTGPNANRKKRLSSHVRQGSGKERTLGKSISDIRTVVSQLDLPYTVAERSVRIFRRAQAEEVFNVGNVQEIYVGAAVYASCREMKIPVLINDIISHLTIDTSDMCGDSVEKSIRQAYSRLCRGLSLTPQIQKPSDYTLLICHEVGRPELSSDAQFVLSEVEDQQWLLTSGRNPRTVAAAAVYAVSQVTLPPEKRPTQREIATAADVTTYSLRQNRDKVAEESDRLQMLDSQPSSEAEIATPA